MIETFSVGIHLIGEALCVGEAVASGERTKPNATASNLANQPYPQTGHRADERLMPYRSLSFNHFLNSDCG